MVVRGIVVNLALLHSHGNSMRLQCAEQSRDELDLVDPWAIGSSNTDNTTAHRPSGRSVMSFYFGGVHICRDTFLKLPGIGKTLIIHYTRVL